MKRTALLLVLFSAGAFAQLKVLCTVAESKTGKAVRDLQTADFIVTDGNASIPVQSVETRSGLIDYILLLDTSLVGGAVQPMAAELIAQLQPKEQMSVITFASSASVAQDFTSNHELLQRAVSSVKPADSPHVLDAVYAALDGGFRGSGFRRVILLLTAGVEGPSRSSEREIARLARSNAVSVYPIYVAGNGRGIFEFLARQTGGAAFNLRDLSKVVNGSAAPAIFETVRTPYTLSLSTNLVLGEKTKITIRGREKVLASMLPVE